MKRKLLKAVAGLAVAVAAAAGVDHNVVAPTPAATRCVQILRVSQGPISR